MTYWLFKIVKLKSNGCHESVKGGEVGRGGGEGGWTQSSLHACLCGQTLSDPYVSLQHQVLPEVHGVLTLQNTEVEKVNVTKGLKQKWLPAFGNKKSTRQSPHGSAIVQLVAQLVDLGSAAVLLLYPAASLRRTLVVTTNSAERSWM